VISVEPVLDLAHGLHGALDVPVARKHDERCVGALA
jgi:hypothetical protein